jgi:hypothetical protein
MDRFWEAEPGWVLVRIDDGLLPFNARSRVADVIEDDEEAERTYREMIDAGVPLLDELPQDEPSR